MDLSETRDKLNETKFFLARLRGEQGQRGDKDAAAFRYYLSAFLNVAYSVTQYLEFETKHVLKLEVSRSKESRKQAKSKYQPLLDEWVESLQTEDRKVWDFMAAMRSGEAHTQRTKTVTKVKAIPLDSTAGGRVHPAYLSSSFSPPALFPNEAERKLKQKLGLPLWVHAWTEAVEHHFEFEGEKRDAVRACETYAGLLERLVDHIGQNTAETGVKK